MGAIHPGHMLPYGPMMYPPHMFGMHHPYMMGMGSTGSGSQSYEDSASTGSMKKTANPKQYITVSILTTGLKFRINQCNFYTEHSETILYNRLSYTCMYFVELNFAD